VKKRDGIPAFIFAIAGDEVPREGEPGIERLTTEVGRRVG